MFLRRMSIKSILLLFVLFSIITNTSMAQQPTTPVDINHPLLCDPDSGICELSTRDATVSSKMILESSKTSKPIKLLYFTDPICSSCWGIEPQLRKLKLEYGNSIEIEYRMGGLLPDWSYNSGGISKPSDVAHHWDEVSVYYDMPIDGSVWLEDPLPSSYPPSIAFKAAQMQSNEKAILFLRAIREMVFLQKKNIAKWEHLEDAARQSALSISSFKEAYEGTAKALFEADLLLSKEKGIRGFPTIIVMDTNGRQEWVYGSKPYSVYENAIIKLYPTIAKQSYNKEPITLFDHYASLTAKEFSVLSGIPRNECETVLDSLVKANMVEVLPTPNGNLWYKKRN